MAQSSPQTLVSWIRSQSLTNASTWFKIELETNARNRLIGMIGAMRRIIAYCHAAFDVSSHIVDGDADGAVYFSLGKEEKLDFLLKTPEKIIVCQVNSPCRGKFFELAITYKQLACMKYAVNLKRGTICLDTFLGGECACIYDCHVCRSPHAVRHADVFE